MGLKVLVSLLLLAAAATAASTNKQTNLVKSETGESSPRVGPGFCRVYTDFLSSGYYTDFTDYVPDLRVYDFDNVIRSTCQTGLWFYYEQVEYNQLPGTVYWMHGIEFCSDLPTEFADKTSSLRYAGSPYDLNGDSFTLYEGTYFTGSEFWGDQDYYPTLDYMNDDGSSLVVNGHSAWTFFTEEQYAGTAVCVYPNTDHDIGTDGTTIDFGIFASMTDLGMPDNSFRSAAKGCFSSVVAQAHPLPALHRASNGAAGILSPPQA